MEFIKKVLGFNSPYSWTKWLRIAALIIAILIAAVYLTEFAFMGIFGFIIMIILFFPTFAVLLGITMGIGFIAGSVQSGKKQVRSFKASSGSAELLNLEKLRAAAQVLNILKVLAAAAAIIALVITVVSISLTVNGESVSFGPALAVTIILVILFIVLSIMAGNRKDKYNAVFKEEIVRKELESFLDIAEFSPGSTFNESVIRESCLFPRYDRYSGNDFLSARYKNRPFTQSDICLEEIHTSTYTDENGDSHTETKYTTVFQGRFMIFDYTTISAEPVFVHDKRIHRLNFAGSALNSIETELDAFNRIFQISASSAVAAFRILTPQVLEGILLASDKLKCPISLAYLNNRIYVAVSNGDEFEAVAVGDSTLLEQRERVKRDVQTVLDMVETLYLRV